jgi:hypothetical protein
MMQRRTTTNPETRLFAVITARALVATGSPHKTVVDAAP